MIRPVADGFQSLVGTTAEVVSKSETGHSVKYLVRAKGEDELWSANSSDALEIGDWVNIVVVKGIGVVIERANDSHNEIGNTKTIVARAKSCRLRSRYSQSIGETLRQRRPSSDRLRRGPVSTLLTCG